MEWRAEISKGEAKKILRERQREIEEKLARATGAFRSEIQVREYESTKSHLGDCSCDRPSANSNNRTKLKKCLIKIDEAWERIRDDTYGICQKCDEPVPKEQLQITPERALCVPCKISKNKNPRSFV